VRLGDNSATRLMYLDSWRLFQGARNAPFSVDDVDDARRKRQRFLRVTPENLNRVLALTGESLVESRRWFLF